MRKCTIKGKENKLKNVIKMEKCTSGVSEWMMKKEIYSLEAGSGVPKGMAGGRSASVTLMIGGRCDSMNWMMSSASRSLTPSGSFWSSWKPFSNGMSFLV